jgi:hypothetical protein
VKPFKSDGWHRTLFYGRITLINYFYASANFLANGRLAPSAGTMLHIGRDGNE